MSGNRLFVDTNIVVYLIQGNARLIKLLSEVDVTISFMTQIEVFAHPEMTEEKAAVFSEVMSVFDVIDITPDIKIETIRIRRDYKLKIPDAIIAASALVSNVPLLTADRAFNRLLNQDIILFDA